MTAGAYRHPQSLIPMKVTHCPTAGTCSLSPTSSSALLTARYAAAAAPSFVSNALNHLIEVEEMAARPHFAQRGVWFAGKPAEVWPQRL